MAELNLDRLAKVCGLLGSEHAGERSEAARRATIMLREAQLTWADLIARCQSVVAVPPKPQRPTATWSPTRDYEPPARWPAKLAVCIANQHHLTEWERIFLRSLRDRFRAPTEKQMVVLDRIYAKVVGDR